MLTRCRLIGAALATFLAGGSAFAQSGVVISQVYGGGGNGGSTYTNDFIELFNRSANPVDLSGWSVQYASASGTSWIPTSIPAGNILQPGQYFLIQEAVGAGGSLPLPTPDVVGTIAMSATAGKVALVNNSMALAGACPTEGVVDFVGFGGANCSEGTPTPTLSNSTAALRNNNGCTDTNSNNADFSVGSAAPRNSASPLSLCTSSVPPSGQGAAMPSPACRETTVVLTVAISQGMGPASPITSVIGDTTQIGGGPGVVFLDDGVPPDAISGDGTYSAQAFISGTTPFASLPVPITITDELGRSGNAGIPVIVANCNPSGFGSANPAGTCAGNTTLIRVTVNPGINPSSTGLQAVVDLSQIGGSGQQSLFDDGTNGDITPGDNVFSYLATIVPGTFETTYAFAATIFDEQGRVGLASNFNFTVVPCVDSGAALVISQVYGGGGNSGAPFSNDFVELFNRTSDPVVLDGLSIQYASANGSYNSKVDLTGTVAPHGYFLIQLAPGANAAAPLPTPDLNADGTSGGTTLALSLSQGNIALVNGITLLGADCATASNILDLVGYGSGSSCFEGVGRAGTLSNTTAAIRSLDGCQDFNQNVADFVVAAPSPRNSASPVNLCGAAPSCPQDFNNDGSVDPDDLGDFINCYFGVPPCNGADFNTDGSVDPDDLGDFINVYFGPGC